MDMDDYGFHLPESGREAKTEELECCRGEIFWVKKDGSVHFGEQKPWGGILATEWYVEAGHPEVIFDFCGMECLKLHSSVDATLR